MKNKCKDLTFGLFNNIVILLVFCPTIGVFFKLMVHLNFHMVQFYADDTAVFVASTLKLLMLFFYSPRSVLCRLGNFFFNLDF